MSQSKNMDASPETDKNGNVMWGNEKFFLHRMDGPAIEWADGKKEWYLEGKKHRENGPAVEWPNGDREWWRNNMLHRENGPAIEHADGTKFWLLKGRRHRQDGPAVELGNGRQEWWLDGLPHREDGPATIDENGFCVYWLNGECDKNVVEKVKFNMAEIERQKIMNGLSDIVDASKKINNLIKMPKKI